MNPGAVHRACCAAAALISVLVAATWALRPALHIEMSPGRIEADQGHAYRTAVGDARFPYTIASDDMSDSRRSTLAVYENGVRLGPPHTAHASIRQDGRGALSHWAGDLVFSASDNTDPRSNGRHYRIEDRARIRPGFLWSCIFALLASLGGVLLAARRIMAPKLARGAMYGSIAASIAVVNYDLLRVSASFPLVTADSDTYFTYWYSRGPFYSAILNIIKSVDASGAMVVPVQLNFILFSLLVLACSVGSVTRSRLAGWATAMLAVWNVGLLRQSLFIMSEPVFIGFVALHIACAILLIRRFSLRMAALAGASLGLAILARPAGYSLVLGLPTLIFLGRERWKAGLATILPAALVLLLGAVPNMRTFGIGSMHSYGGLSLFGHVLHLARPGLATAYPQLYAGIVSKTGPAVNSGGAKYPIEHAAATANQYNYLLWQLAVPEILRFVYEESESRGAKLSPANFHDEVVANGRADGIARTLAVAIILDQPLQYLMHVTAHLAALWDLTFFGHPPLRETVTGAHAQASAFYPVSDSLKAYFGSAIYPPPWAGDRLARRSADSGLADAISGVVRQGMRELLPLLVLATLVGAAMVLLRMFRLLELSLAARALAYSSFQIWAYFGFVASVQAALERYAVVFEPVLLAAFVLGSVLLGRRIRMLWNGCVRWSRMFWIASARFNQLPPSGV